MTFDNAWQQLLTVSDKLQAESQEVLRAQAEQKAGEDLGLPSVDIKGSYTHLEKPIELDLRDLNPLASLGSESLPPALGGALASIPSSMFVTPLPNKIFFVPVCKPCGQSILGEDHCSSRNTCCARG